MIAVNQKQMVRRAPVVGISFLLSQVGAHAAYKFEESLSAVDLKPYHAGLLRMLDANPGLSQQDLSNLFGVFPSRLVVLLDQLEARRLIRRRKNPSDRRGHRVYLTKAGQKALTTIGKLTRGLETELCSALSDEEKATLLSVLERIVAQQNVTPAVHPAYKKLQEGRGGSSDESGSRLPRKTRGALKAKLSTSNHHKEKRPHEPHYVSQL
jgi:DNA-binding MarR family transcriptional regulator